MSPPYFSPLRSLAVLAGILVTLAAGAAFAGGCGQAVNGVCAQKAVVQKVVAQPVVAHHAQAVKAVPVVQQHIYLVGAQVRQDAVIAQAVEQALARIEAKRVTTQTVTTTELQAHPAPVAQYVAPVAAPVTCNGCGQCAPVQAAPAPIPAAPQPQAPPAENSPPPADDAPPTFSSTAPHGLGSQVSASCVRCHGGPSPAAGIDLSGPLDDGTRLAAMRAIASGAMPKNASLSADERNKLLSELLTGR